MASKIDNKEFSDNFQAAGNGGNKPLLDNIF
jgi:hypothetical protein